MNATTALADLDELILWCRDDKARLYIVEAVACYRSGAYRSAIVATWIAVCYDIIDKLRELSLSGDQAATQQIDIIERSRSSNDFMRALSFERDILKLARDQFELISPLEYIDLSRLQEDRNRCAHPSLISQDQGFNPSGELARLHIRSAVLHLLQHQPVQGKYALERLLREARSEYFPDTSAKAVQALSSGPLKRPRDSLVRNFVIVLLKDVLTPTLDWKARLRAFAALSAVKKLHHRIFELTLKDRLPSFFRALPDDALHWGIWVLTRFDDYWNILPQDVRLKIEAYTSALPEEHFMDIDSILTYAPLRQHAERRVQSASRADIKNSLFFELPPVVADRCIALYLQSNSYAQANEWAAEMRMYADSFSVPQQRRILAGINNNDQLMFANTVSSVISALRNSKKIAPAEFESELESNGLQKFMLDC
jgi:hypothetical protein